MAINTNITYQAWGEAEAAFNDTTYVSGLAATNVFDCDRLDLRGSLNRVMLRNRRGTPDQFENRAGRQTAEWSTSCPWKPSGTLGTIGRNGFLVKAAMGASTAPALSTTVASGASATGATLTSGSGLAVGDCVVVTMPAGHREVTRLKTVAGAAVTWDALSATPSVSAAVVSGVNFKQQTAVPDSIYLVKAYVDNTDQEVVTGAIVDEMVLTFAGDEHVMLSLRGPGARYRTAGATIPGSTTFLGSPITSFDGNNYIDGNAFLLRRLVVTYRHNLALRNTEIGVTYASGQFRNDFREIRVEAEYYFEDTDIETAAEAVTATTVRHIAGNVNGSMLGVVIPIVEWERPVSSSADNGAVIMTATGTVKASTGNDAIFLTEA